MATNITLLLDELLDELLKKPHTSIDPLKEFITKHIQHNHKKRVRFGFVTQAYKSFCKKRKITSGSTSILVNRLRYDFDIPVEIGRYRKYYMINHMLVGLDDLDDLDFVDDRQSIFYET